MINRIEKEKIKEKIALKFFDYKIFLAESYMKTIAKAIDESLEEFVKKG